MLFWGKRTLIVLNVGLIISYFGLWMIASRKDIFWSADFSAFYTGWAIVRDGLGHRLYDFDLQAQVQQAILGGQSFKEGLLPFNNPPHVAVIFAPLAWLPRPAAFAVWTAAQIALLVWLAWLLARMFSHWEPAERRWLWLGILAFPPLLYNLMLGAFSLLMLIGLLMLYDALQHSRELEAGGWLFLGAIKPQIFLLPGVILLAARRWRALVAAGAAALAAFLFSSLFLGWQSWLDYLNQLRTVSSFFGIHGITPSLMYNFKGTLALLLQDQHVELINALSLAALAICTLATLLLWRGAWKPGQPGHQLRWAITLTLGTLFSLHANPQDGLILIAPAVLFYDYLRQQNGPEYIAFAAFALACPALFLLSEFTIAGRLGIRLPVVAMLILTIWLCRALWLEHITSPRTSHA